MQTVFPNRILARWVLLLLLPGLMGSCASNKQKYKQQYALVWKQLIQSEKWQSSLEASSASGPFTDDIFYSRAPAPRKLLVQNERYSAMDATFVKKYHSLVSRAYFRLIAEAEKADRHIQDAYRKLVAEHQEKGLTNSSEFRKRQTLALQKYIAHQRMLNGLKSWNAFSSHGSDDLDFFREEQVGVAYRMVQQDKSDEQIIRYLMRKLADLYHFEETEALTKKALRPQF